MRTQTIYDFQTNALVGVMIYGNYSNEPVYATNELVDALGGIEPAFHEIKRLRKNQILPRTGIEAMPLSTLDLRYALENERKGYRHWQWQWIIIGVNTIYSGYGYVDGDTFCFCDTSNDTVELRVGLEYVYPEYAAVKVYYEEG